MTDLGLLRAAIGDVAIEGDAAHHLAAERFGEAFGLVRMPYSRVCLAKLAGQRCPRNVLRGERCAGCDLGIKIIDHTAAWKRPHDRRASVLTSQPYGPDVDAAARIAEQFGMSLMVDASLSWHFPGATTLVVFDAQGVIQ